MRSIRRDLTWRLLVGLTLLVVVVGAGIFGILRAVLLRDFDAALLAKTQALASLVQQEPGGKYELEFTDELMPEFKKGRHAEYFQVWLNETQVLARSRSLGQAELPWPHPMPSGKHGFNLTLPDGRRGRAIALKFIPQVDVEEYLPGKSARPKPDPNVRATIVVARGRGDLDRLLQLLALAMAGLCLTLPLLIALVVWLVVRRGLGPLTDVAATASRITADNLDYRYRPDALPLELQPICGRLNDLLERLETAFARQRRFNGDVAHELRTPIAELRTMAEVALMAPEDHGGTVQTLREVLQVAGRMERLIGSLLTLARSEAESRHIAREAVDLADELRLAWTAGEARGLRRDRILHWRVDSPLPILTNRAVLQSILENLIANAMEYTPAGGTIAITAERAGERVSLRIANANASLEPSDLPHLFEPFWRKDPARSDETHLGLGLALVAAFCKALRAPMLPEIQSDGTFSLTLRFEPAPEPDGQRRQGACVFPPDARGPACGF
jgi:two-component system sensor histidine kinase QseC